MRFRMWTAESLRRSLVALHIYLVDMLTVTKNQFDQHMLCVFKFLLQLEMWLSATMDAWTFWVCPGKLLKVMWTLTQSHWEIRKELSTPSLSQSSALSVFSSLWCLDVCITSQSPHAVANMKITQLFRSAHVRVLQGVVFSRDTFFLYFV